MCGGPRHEGSPSGGSSWASTFHTTRSTMSILPKLAFLLRSQLAGASFNLGGEASVDLGLQCSAPSDAQRLSYPSLPMDIPFCFATISSKRSSTWVLRRPLSYPSTGNLSSCFFYLEGVISVCSYSFWRRSNYFLRS